MMLLIPRICLWPKENHDSNMVRRAVLPMMSTLKATCRPQRPKWQRNPPPTWNKWKTLANVTEIIIPSWNSYGCRRRHTAIGRRESSKCCFSLDIIIQHAKSTSLKQHVDMLWLFVVVYSPGYGTAGAVVEIWWQRVQLVVDDGIFTRSQIIRQVFDLHLDSGKLEIYKART